MKVSHYFRKMTKEQATLFFKHSPTDNLHELWETRFFEHKQFFLTRPPIEKVWSARLKKIEKQHTAFLVLTSAKKDEKNKEVLIDNKFEFSDNPITCFNQLHQKRNEFKSLLLRAQSADELIVIIASWLTLEKKYAQTWSYVACSDNHLSVLQGKEPDPMEILAALKKVKSDNQIESIALLKDNYNNLPETIQKEVKRLTLLAKE